MREGDVEFLFITQNLAFLLNSKTTAHIKVFSTLYLTFITLFSSLNKFSETSL